MKIDLLGGDYQPRSVLASCQRRVNLYAEMTAQDHGEPATVVHYPTPGLRLLATTPNGKPVRGLFRASNGDLYCAAGFDVYYIDRKWVFHLVGTMKTTRKLNPVKFSDNGTSIVLCDGTPTNGYAINAKTRLGLTPLYNPSASDSFTTSSTGFRGSTYFDFSDGFLIANSPGDPTFYISNSEDVIFDPLQFADKTVFADPLVAAIASHRVIWLIGELYTEVWYNSGGSATNTMPYEVMPGVAIDWGCRAPYSIAKADSAIFWLAQNLTGEVVVLQGSGYKVKRISTHALEHEIAGYSNPGDAIGYTILLDGHLFYRLSFLHDDVTWVFDAMTDRWHQSVSLDDHGNEHKHRATMAAFAYDTLVANDWQNGNLYAFDNRVFTDQGRPVQRVVSFPRLLDHDSDRRLRFNSFIAELDTGETLNAATNVDIMLQWSDDKGRTWSNGIRQSLGTVGQFAKFVKWQRLGSARNRVFRLQWSADAMVAITGAFVEVTPAAT